MDQNQSKIIMGGNVNYTLALDPDQKKFFDMIEELGFSKFWDIKNRLYDQDLVEARLRTVSHSESIMLRFCLGVWKHDNSFRFDFVDAAATLEPSQMIVITSWMTEPFWP